jgi:hypothetical protein
MGYLKEIFQLCKSYQKFFIKYDLKNERELVTEAGLNAYIDFLMKLINILKKYSICEKKIFIFLILV